MMTGDLVYEAVLRELKNEYTTTITPSEFNYHIRVAQIEYTKTRYWAWDQHQKSIEDLSALKVVTNGIGGMPSPLSNMGSTAPNSQWTNSPQDLQHLLSVSAICIYQGEPCRKNGSLSDPIACTYLADDKMNLVRSDYYSKPRPEFPCLYYYQADNKFYFWAGTSIAHKVILSYQRYMTPIEVDPVTGANVTGSELGDMQTYEIVKWCALSYLEKIEEARMQTLSALLGTQFTQNPSFPN